jgi:hypothetical protein
VNPRRVGSGRRVVDELADILDEGQDSSRPRARTVDPETAALAAVAAQLRGLSRPDPLLTANPGVRRDVLNRLQAAHLRRRRTRFASSLAAAGAVVVLTVGTAIAGPGNVADAVGGAVESVVSVLRAQLGQDQPPVPGPSESVDPVPSQALEEPDRWTPVPPTVNPPVPTPSPPGEAVDPRTAPPAATPAPPAPLPSPPPPPSSAPSDGVPSLPAGPPHSPGPPDTPGPPPSPGPPSPQPTP